VNPFNSIVPLALGVFTGIFYVALLSRWIHTTLVAIRPWVTPTPEVAKPGIGQVALATFLHPGPWLLLIVTIAVMEGRKYVSGPAFHSYFSGVLFSFLAFIGLAGWIAMRFRAERKRRAGAV
jgi:hypothetical protein